MFQAFLWHLRYAIMLATSRENGQLHYRARTASRDLLALLCAKNPDCMELLARCFPPGVMRALFSVPEADAAASTLPAATPGKAKGKAAAPPAVSANSRRPSSLGPQDAEILAKVAADELDVSLGSNHELWWNVGLCAKVKDHTQRAAAERKVKRVWYGIDTLSAGSGVADGTSPAKLAPSVPASDSKMRLNWPALWSLLRNSCATPSLVWSADTLKELQTCLLECERNLDLKRRLAERNKKLVAAGADAALSAAACVAAS